MDSFKISVANILIIGGTGSLGNAITERFKDNKGIQIGVFSRDEAKQHFMRLKYPDTHFFIGDVRDVNSLRRSINSFHPHYIVHAAAMKQVPSCEAFPEQGVATNTMGAHNLIEAISQSDVYPTTVVNVSTDKAVYPINAYGASKFLAEKIFSAAQLQQTKKTIFCNVRYGNVMGSRGSVIPLFKQQIENNEGLTVTEPNMTRFMLKLDEAVDLILAAISQGVDGYTYVKKSPACTIDTLARAVQAIYGVKDDPIDIIGIRPGEKMHEALLTAEENAVIEDVGDDIVGIPPGVQDVGEMQPFTSAITKQLNVEEVIQLLHEANVL